MADHYAEKTEENNSKRQQQLAKFGQMIWKVAG